METGAFRELLSADVAVELGVLTAAEAGLALAKFWETGRASLLGQVADADRARVEAEVERLLSEAGGDPQAAVAKRGVARELPASLAPEASHALSEAGARLRAPLRSLDKKRYVGFLPLGEGGMGVVYLALDSELNRRVAFKMIRSGAADPLADKSGPVSDDMVARFMQEAVVTGGLEHPGIVPVYELGVTPSGVPYYTMRLVRGERTFEDAIAAARSGPERLRLIEPFLKVCDAVGYAHSRGVIHRDLKPANIALGEFGEVVVLDWGLAKMRKQPDLAGSRWQSRLSELRETTDLKTLTSALGTPGYMAPEAALGEVDKIDERSDVYSLGAILHRILTGEFPFRFTTFEEFMANLMRGVETTPDPQGLGRICVRALAGRRADRFATVKELASAIRAWQDESAIDREVDVLGAEADAALETALSLAGDAQLRQLDRAMAAAARILDLRPGDERAAGLTARARELRAEAIQHREAAARRRLMKRVGVVGLLAATAATVVVAVLLNARRKEAEASRARAEDLAGFMLHDLHEGLVPVGRLDLLGQVARKSLDYYASLPDADVTDDVLSARALALGRIGEVLHSSGDLEAALRSCRESQRLYERLDDRYELSVALNRLGDVQQETADLDDALASYRRSAELRRAIGREKDLPRSLDRVADVLMRRGERTGAVEHYAESLAIRRKLYREAPGDEGRQRDLALSLQKQGELAVGNLPEALRHFEASLALLRKLRAAAPSDADRMADVASCMFRVAHCRTGMGDGAGGGEAYREALRIYRRLVALDPTNIWHQRDLALTLDRLGEHIEALEVRRALVARHPTNARARSDLVDALFSTGDDAKSRKEYPEALARYEEALAIAQRLTKEDATNTEWHRDVSMAHYRIGDLHRAAGRTDDARGKFEASLAVARWLVDKDPANTDWQRDLALAYDRLDRHEESLAIRRSLFRKDPTNVTWSNDFVTLLARVGDKTKTVAPYEEAVAVHRELAPSEAQQRELSYCLYRLGTLQEQAGELELALPAAREAEAIHRGLEAYRHEHQWWADAYFRIAYRAACAAAAAGDRARALGHLAEHVRWCRAHLPQRQIADHFARARHQEPDLKSLRGTEEFESLFAAD